LRPQFRQINGLEHAAMMWHDVTFALRTLAHLFTLRGPVLVLFWLAVWAGLEVPSPLAAALGLWLVLRFAKYVSDLRQAHMPILPGDWTVAAIAPFAPLLLGDAWLMLLCSACVGLQGVTLWRWSELREHMMQVRPSPIEEAGLWMDVQAVTALAVGALGLALSLTNDPAIWITGFTLGSAALDLTALLYLRSVNRI
jgi:hypothetical protein